MVANKTLLELTTDDIDGLSTWDLRIYLRASIGVIRLKDIELQRAYVARHMAEYNYHSAMLTKHQALLAKAQRDNSGES